MQKGQNGRKGMNAAALVTQCRSIGRKTETGSSFNAAALKTQCRSIGKKAEIQKLAESRMPQHWGVNAAALVPEAEKNKEFDIY